MNTSQGRVRVVRSPRGVTILPLDWDDIPTPGARTAATPVAGGVVMILPQDPDGPMAACAICTAAGPRPC